MKNEYNKLQNDSIIKLILGFSIPTITAMLVSSIYNVVDRMFVGKYVGELALGGLIVAFPVMLTIISFSLLIGTGAAPLIAIKMGEKKEQEAANIFGNMSILAIFTSIILTLFVYIFMDFILKISNVTPEIKPIVKEYLKIITLGFPLLIISIVLNTIIRTEGKPQLAMITMLASTLTNIILDYIFIIPLNLGVKGAAWATVIGQGVGCFWLISHYLSGKSPLTKHLKTFKLDFKIINKIIVLGFSAFITHFGSCFGMILVNGALMQYGANKAITAMGAISSLFSLFIFPIFGIQQGIQPIISFNYGAQLIKRVKQTYMYSIFITIIYSTIIFTLMFIFPNFFLGLFIKQESSTMQLAINGFRLYILVLPLLGFHFLSTGFFQSISKSKESLLQSLMRQIILIPILFILPHYFGLNGVWLSTPLADLTSVITSFIITTIEFKRDKRYALSAV